MPRKRQTNKRYSKELKTEAYLRGEGSLRKLSKKYGIVGNDLLRNWIKLYNGRGEIRERTAAKAELFSFVKDIFRTQGTVSCVQL